MKALTWHGKGDMRCEKRARPTNRASTRRHHQDHRFRMAQTPVQDGLPMLLERIQKGEIDPSFVITHRASLEDGPDLYKTFRDKKDGCIKVVLKR